MLSCLFPTHSTRSPHLGFTGFPTSHTFLPRTAASQTNRFADYRTIINLLKFVVLSSLRCFVPVRFRIIVTISSHYNNFRRQQKKESKKIQHDYISECIAARKILLNNSCSWTLNFKAVQLAILRSYLGFLRSICCQEREIITIIEGTKSPALKEPSSSS